MSQLVDKPLIMANNMTDTIIKPDMTTPNHTEKSNAEPNGNTAGQSCLIARYRVLNSN
ncbi:hypothetical protein JCM18902_2013 [Psychrobacter sp. JCM 18902]|nr:hypothetical protein JCM18902_2013 [Psychrobacter sp. JCM 18902]